MIINILCWIIQDLLLACKLARGLRVCTVEPENFTIIQAAPAVNTFFNWTLIKG